MFSPLGFSLVLGVLHVCLAALGVATSETQPTGGLGLYYGHGYREIQAASNPNSNEENTRARDLDPQVEAGLVYPSTARFIQDISAIGTTLTIRTISASFTHAPFITLPAVQQGTETSSSETGSSSSSSPAPSTTTITIDNSRSSHSSQSSTMSQTKIWTNSTCGRPSMQTVTMVLTKTSFQIASTMTSPTGPLLAPMTPCTYSHGTGLSALGCIDTPVATRMSPSVTSGSLSASRTPTSSTTGLSASRAAYAPQQDLKAQSATPCAIDTKMLCLGLTLGSVTVATSAGAEHSQRSTPANTTTSQSEPTSFKSHSVRSTTTVSAHKIPEGANDNLTVFGLEPTPSTTEPIPLVIPAPCAFNTRLACVGIGSQTVEIGPLSTDNASRLTSSSPSPASVTTVSSFSSQSTTTSKVSALSSTSSSLPHDPYPYPKQSSGSVKRLKVPMLLSMLFSIIPKAASQASATLHLTARPNCKSATEILRRDYGSLESTPPAWATPNSLITVPTDGGWGGLSPEPTSSSTQINHNPITSLASSIMSTTQSSSTTNFGFKPTPGSSPISFSAVTASAAPSATELLYPSSSQSIDTNVSDTISSIEQTSTFPPLDLSIVPVTKTATAAPISVLKASSGTSKLSIPWCFSLLYFLVDLAGSVNVLSATKGPHNVRGPVSSIPPTAFPTIIPPPSPLTIPGWSSLGSAEKSWLSTYVPPTMIMPDSSLKTQTSSTSSAPTPISSTSWASAGNAEASGPASNIVTTTTAILASASPLTISGWSSLGSAGKSWLSTYVRLSATTTDSSSNTQTSSTASNYPPLDLEIIPVTGTTAHAPLSISSALKETSNSDTLDIPKFFVALRSLLSFDALTVTKVSYNRRGPVSSIPPTTFPTSSPTFPSPDGWSSPGSAQASWLSTYVLPSIITTNVQTGGPQTSSGSSIAPSIIPISSGSTSYPTLLVTIIPVTGTGDTGPLSTPSALKASSSYKLGVPKVLVMLRFVYLAGRAKALSVIAGPPKARGPVSRILAIIYPGESWRTTFFVSSTITTDTPPHSPSSSISSATGLPSTSISYPPIGVTIIPVTGSAATEPPIPSSSSKKSGSARVKIPFLLLIFCFFVALAVSTASTTTFEEVLAPRRCENQRDIVSCRLPTPPASSLQNASTTYPSLEITIIPVTGTAGTEPAPISSKRATSGCSKMRIPGLLLHVYDLISTAHGFVPQARTFTRTTAMQSTSATKNSINLENIYIGPCASNTAAECTIKGEDSEITLSAGFGGADGWGLAQFMGPCASNTSLECTVQETGEKVPVSSKPTRTPVITAAEIGPCASNISTPCTLSGIFGKISRMTTTGTLSPSEIVLDIGPCASNTNSECTIQIGVVGSVSWLNPTTTPEIVETATVGSLTASGSSSPLGTLTTSKTAANSSASSAHPSPTKTVKSESSKVNAPRLFLLLSAFFGDLVANLLPLPSTYSKQGIRQQVREAEPDAHGNAFPIPAEYAKYKTKRQERVAELDLVTVSMPPSFTTLSLPERNIPTMVITQITFVTIAVPRATSESHGMKKITTPKFWAMFTLFAAILVAREWKHKKTERYDDEEPTEAELAKLRRREEATEKTLAELMAERRKKEELQIDA